MYSYLQKNLKMNLKAVWVNKKMKPTVAWLLPETHPSHIVQYIPKLFICLEELVSQISSCDPFRK